MRFIWVPGFLVDGMQQRIYRAESLGRKRTVRNLQRILMHSKAALLLSIKRITQDNRGKRTAGIDGNIVANDSERIMLYEKMKKLRVNQHNPKPSYRIYIKKKNGKLRPLSIPTIMDRVWQNAVKLALEPQWEYHFESTSYGFRPGRGCHDAIERIFQSGDAANAGMLLAATLLETKVSSNVTCLPYVWAWLQAWVHSFFRAEQRASVLHFRMQRS